MNRRALLRLAGLAPLAPAAVVAAVSAERAPRGRGAAIIGGAHCWLPDANALSYFSLLDGTPADRLEGVTGLWNAGIIDRAQVLAMLAQPEATA